MGDIHYNSDTDDYYDEQDDVNLSDICDKSDGSDDRRRILFYMSIVNAPNKMPIGHNYPFTKVCGPSKFSNYVFACMHYVLFVYIYVVYNYLDINILLLYVNICLYFQVVYILQGFYKI